MAKEGILSTPREQTKTADQMLESLINARNARIQNVNALGTARKLENSVPDFTAAMEAGNLATEAQLKQTSALENASYKRGSQNIALQKLRMRETLLQEGMQYVTEQVLKEIIYESYWLDDDVKEKTVDHITDSIDNVLGYIEENCKESKVAESKQSTFLKNVASVIEGIVKKAVTRICEEAESDDTVFAEFGLTDAEEDELDEKLIDLGRDEIVDLIKAKVAQVVQDEKEKGQERAEMFKEIDQMSEDDPAEGNLTETEESVIVGIEDGSIVTEGANWDTLKIYFSGLRKRASRYCKEANKLYSQGKYEDAMKKYAECKDIFNDIKKRLVDIDDTIGSVVISYFLSYFTPFVAFVDSINTRGGASNIDIGDAHKDADTWNVTRQYVIANVNKMIRYCDTGISQCKKHSSEEKTGKAKDYKYSLESAIGNTPNEKYLIGILECGAEVRLFDDPTWGEFKSYVSLMSKKIKECLEKGSSSPKGDCDYYGCAKSLIEELETRLSDVPESIPADVKSFVMGMVSIIYTAVPPSDVIISRFGMPVGAPDLSQKDPNSVNMATISWTDLFVNIKTNFSSIKSYCDNKLCGQTIDNTDLNNSECPTTGRRSIAQLIARNQSQILTRNIGGSLFEAMMIGSISNCSKSAMESSLMVTDEDVEDAALVETLLHYNVFETLDTLGIYKFRLSDVQNAKRAFMSPVTEISILSAGKDKKGLKKARINTRKMKKKKEIMKSSAMNGAGSDN